MATAGSEVTYLRPTSGWQAIHFAELWRFRDLLVTLAGKDLKLRYKQTALGLVWVILQPLMAAAIFWFVFGVVAKMRSGNTPYFLLAFTGLAGWNVFSSSLNKVSLSMVGNAQLVSKIYFPRLILPLSTLASTLVDFSVACGILTVLLIVYGIVPTAAMLLFPVWVLFLLMTGLGVGLMGASLTVSYRDVQHALPLVLPFLMYASPVAYRISQIPEQYRTLYRIVNPVSNLIEACRWSVLGGDPPEAGYIAYSIAVAVTALVSGAVIFRRKEKSFADVI